jgi:hypothetical protein
MFECNFFKKKCHSLPIAKKGNIFIHPPERHCHALKVCEDLRREYMLKQKSQKLVKFQVNFPGQRSHPFAFATDSAAY